MERRRFYAEELLTDLLALYQTTGLIVWGQVQGSPGTYQKLLVQTDGTVVVTGTTTVTGSVDITDRSARLLGHVNVDNFPASPYDVSDRSARQLGLIYGSQNQQIQQRATTYDLIVQLRSGGSEIDPRSIRALTSSDIVTALVNYPSGTLIDPRSIRVLASSDVVTAYGSQTQALLQRATTYDLIVQLRSSGSEIDPRSIRALTTSDQITPIQTTRTSLTVMPEREDLSSLAALISPSAAGVQLIAGVAGKKIKVKLWGYHSTVAGQHFFYFGTSTTAPTLGATPSTKVFGVSLTVGHYRQSCPDPHESGAGDGLYFYASGTESNMSVDWQSVQE